MWRNCGPNCLTATLSQPDATYFSIGAQSYGSGTRCLRVKSYVTVRACKTRFRLLARLCREGFDTSEFQKVVSVDYNFPQRQRQCPSR
jgi:hypothetical protein